MQGLGPLATLLVTHGQEARPLLPRLTDGELIDSFMRVFASMQAVVLRSLVAGTLPRDKLRNQAVSQAIAALLLASMNQLGLYDIALLISACHPPIPQASCGTIKLIKLYSTVDGTLEHEQLEIVYAIDTTSSPVYHTVHWSFADLKTKTLRYHLSSPDKPDQLQAWSLCCADAQRGNEDSMLLHHLRIHYFPQRFAALAVGLIDLSLHRLVVITSFPRDKLSRTLERRPDATSITSE